MLHPASHVIEICGGFDVVAEMVDRHPTRVRRWTYPKNKGGTGGLIPADMQVVLMREAEKRSINLTPSDFFAQPQDAA